MILNTYKYMVEYMSLRGTLYIITAASGTGKTSLSKELSKIIDNISISISYTTRQIRANEQDNQHYFFISKEEFEDLIKKNLLIEYTYIFGCYYGSSLNWIKKQLEAGIDVILNINWHGAIQIRKQLECISIFLLPPSIQALHHRLETRKRENEQIIAERLAAASSEIIHCTEFDYIIINDNFNNALQDLKSIIQSKRLLSKKQSIKYKTLIHDLSCDNNI